MPTTTPERPPLDAQALAARAATLGEGRWRVEVLTSTPSTNAVVAERWRAGEVEGLVVATDHQTAGRGRLDRVWVTPARAALTFSILVSPDAVPAARWPWLPLLTGVAVVEAVRRIARVDVALKWPNDVMLGEAKLAGILVERVEGPRGAAAVIGVGLNVSQTAEELPVTTATSLVASRADLLVDRADVLLAVLESFAGGYDAWAAVGGAPAAGLRADYVRHCATIGQQVRVELPQGGRLDGEATGVDPEGRLLVRGDDGVRALGAGDVVHVRRG